MLMYKILSVLPWFSGWHFPLQVHDEEQDLLQQQVAVLYQCQGTRLLQITGWAEVELERLCKDQRLEQGGDDDLPPQHVCDPYEPVQHCDGWNGRVCSLPLRRETTPTKLPWRPKIWRPKTGTPTILRRPSTTRCRIGSRRTLRPTEP